MSDPAKWYNNRVNQGKASNVGESEAQGKPGEKLTLRTGGTGSWIIQTGETSVTATKAKSVIAQAGTPKMGVEKVKAEKAAIEALTITSYVGGFYKKRSAAGDVNGIYSQDKVTFKLTEHVHGDGHDHGHDHDDHDHSHDSAFAYSMAGVALATAALVF